MSDQTDTTADVIEEIHEGLRADLDGLPLTHRRRDEIAQLLTIADALVVGLRAAVYAEREDAQKVESGLDALEAHFMNLGFLDGSEGARRWHEAAERLAALGEPTPSGDVVYSLDEVGGRDVLPWRFLA